jgi:hypothetical protein
VQQASGSPRVQNAADRLGVHRLAAEEQVPYRPEGVGDLAGDLIEQGRRQEQGRDPLVAQELGQPPRRQRHVAVDADQGRRR